MPASPPAPLAPLRAYLRLRGRTVGRQIREVGWVRLALLVPVLLAAFAKVLLTAAAHPWGRWALPVGWALLLLVPAHRRRPDWTFLALAAPTFRQWLAAEYALLTLPVVVALAGHGAWAAAGLAPVLGAAVARMGPARAGRATRQRWRSPFRSVAFEWVSGMRRAALWAGGALWAWPVLVGLAGWQRAGPLGPLGALATWLLLLANCYGTPEPATMLVLGAPTPRQWLRQRLAWGLGYAVLTAWPFLGMLAAGPAGVGGALAVGLATLTLLALLVLTKYAFYPNTMHIRFSQGLLLGWVVLMLSSPLYPVLLVVALGGLSWQSQRRLRSVLASPEPG